MVENPEGEEWVDTMVETRGIAVSERERCWARRKGNWS